MDNINYDNLNYDNLNNMINYIEDNLENEININELAKIVGISSNSLQRIFNFMSGITISEYIKKRRLSNAFEEIKTTDKKIIDIAIKYRYNSSISFDRAFKKAFGITPMQCKASNVPYKQFPMIIFEKKQSYKQLNYQIKYLEEKEIYCYKAEDSKFIDRLYKIRKLYRYLEKIGIYEKLKKEKQYAISTYENGLRHYAVGSETKYTSEEKMKIPAGTYAIFEVGSREQKDIVNSKKYIYSEWLKSTEIDIDPNFTLEYYVGDNCYLCMSVLDCKRL